MPDLLEGAPKYVALAIVGIALIVVARRAARHRGSRLDTFVAMRVGEVLLTEVVGAFAVGYAIGALIAPPDRPQLFPPGPGPGPRGGFGALRSLPIGLGLVGALAAALSHIDVRDALLGGRASRNPVHTYIGWEARVVAHIPARGFGEILMRDGMGNVMSVAATADTEITVGTRVRVVATRDLNIVVAPI